MKFSADRAARFAPYVPGEQNNGVEYIKLNTNESPYPPPPSVTEAAARAAQSLNLYSDPELRDLKLAIADSVGVTPDMITASNGSDEALGFVFAAFADDTHPLATPDVTYSFYHNIATMFNIPYHTIPLNVNLEPDVRDWCAINKTVVIPNPAAHTGLQISNSAIAAICGSNPDNIVVIDEAYTEFTDENAVPLLRDYQNLIIVRTLSKSRFLAGLRVGYIIANSEIINEIERVRAVWSPYNVGSVGIAAAAAAMREKEYYDEHIEKICVTREYFKRELKNLGFFVTDSHANFVLCETDKIGGEQLYLELKERGFLVRSLKQPRISNMLRISIGSQPDMEKLVETLRAILL